MAKQITNLTDEDVLAVCEIIDGWSHDTKLSWDSLVKAIEKHLFKLWSRQALDRHTKIKQAFILKKKRLRISEPLDNEEKIPTALRAALQTIQRLESENERLTKENEQLVQKFRLWSYNAFNNGISEDVLNTPKIARGRGGTRDE